MKWGKPILLLVILLVILLYPGDVQGDIPSNDSLQFMPQLGPFIPIWIDAMDNISPSVAYNPLHDEYLVVWVTKQGEFSWDIWGRRIRGDGSLIPNGWFNIDNVAGYHLVDPDVVYNPYTDQYLVVYTYELSDTNHDIWGKFISWNGVLSSRIIIDSRLLVQKHPAVAYNSQEHQYVIAYCDHQASGSMDVYLRTLDESGSLVGSAILAAGDPYSCYFEPDVAYIEQYNHYLVVYGAEFPFIPRILGKTISADLSSLSPEFHYNDDEVIGYNPDIACSLNECLVSWGSGTHGYVKARRVSLDGTPLGPFGGFEIGHTIENIHKRVPSVSLFNPWGYLVVWFTWDIHSNDHGDIYSRVVGFGKDQPLGSEYPVDNRPYYESQPSLACGPTGSCLLVNTHNPLEYPAGDDEISGRLIYTPQVFQPLIIR